MTPLRDEPPRFFLDRGLGARLVPNGLRTAGWPITTMDERYGAAASQSIQDVQWIREATAAGENLLCKDAAIAKVPLEAEAVYMNDARIFVLTDARLTGEEMLGVLLRHEKVVFKWARQVRAPFVLGLGLTSTRRLTLRYPLPGSP